MAERTNPRKVTEASGLTVVSLPPNFPERCGLELGDQVVLEPREDGFRAYKTEWIVSDGNGGDGDA